MKEISSLPLALLGCAAAVAAAGSYGAPVRPRPFLPCGTRARRGPGASVRIRGRGWPTPPSFLFAGGQTRAPSFEKWKRGSGIFSLSASSFDSDRGGGGTSKKEGRFALPRIDPSVEKQMSAIFGANGDGSWGRLGAGSSLVPLSMAGRWSRERLSPGDPPPAEAILLSPPEECGAIADAYERCLKSRDGSSATPALRPVACMSVPLSPPGGAASRLLSRAYSAQPLSKSVLLSLNSLLVNRDGGLFDNLPWSTWSVDPDLKERDTAGNVVEGKFTMGKRVAYQRFMGKDWQGRSMSLGNLAKRVRYLLEGDEDEEGYGTTPDDIGSWNDKDSMMSLSQRLLQLEVKEAQMEVAGCEQLLAIYKAQSLNDLEEDNVHEYRHAAEQLEKAQERLRAAESSLQELTAALETDSEEWDAPGSLWSGLPWGSSDHGLKKGRSKVGSLVIAFLDKLAEQENPPPYRGAIGYSAKLDTKEEMFNDSMLPYSSPYELLLEIISEQLNSEVAGCVLEPASLLKGNLVLGGALLLKRRGVWKSAILAGEEVSYTDDDDDLGNEGVLPRSMYVVECFSDEAVGVAMAAGVPVFVEEEIYSRAGNVPVELDMEETMAVKTEYGGEGKLAKGADSLPFAKCVPPVRPLDRSSLVPQTEGDRLSSEKESDLVRSPLTTSPRLFDGSIKTPRPALSAAFSTFNPVKSLDEYDALSDDAKVRMLLKLESFAGALPRPRAVRVSKARTDASYDDGMQPSLLDDILLPLVDESVRRQFMIRDAMRRGDHIEADELRAETSPRQAALEGARRARGEGSDDEAGRLEEEAELYRALRADSTQDVGTYSRFLDRDEWYEREAQARIKRLDKSKFGTLLDGIDLP